MADKVGALFAIGSVFIAFGCFYGIWVQHCIDDSRQKLFSARDKLFDAARAGKIDFQSMEYKRTRASIEMLIRYAHKITFWRMVIYKIRFCTEARIHKKTPLQELITSIDDFQIRTELEGFENRMQHVIARLVWKRSLFLIILVSSMKTIELVHSIAKPWTIAATNIAVYIAELGEERGWRQAQRLRNL